LGYGAPRDWVLGMRVALADGRLVKSGGKVVKNVAGYDLHKVQIGALGTLGVIVEATFKVAPRPERLGALLVGCATRTQALELAVRLRKWPLTPASLALIAGRAVATFADVLPDHRSHTLVAARFDGVPAAVERQMRAAAECAKDLGAWYTELGDDHVDALWQRLALFSAPLEERQSELLLRAAARPAELPAVLTALERGAPGEEAWAVGYGGVGLAQAGWPIMGDTASALARLRAGLAALEGYAVVEAVPADVRSHLDIWGAPPTTLPLMRALKNQWDPYRILNRGRYVGGI
jgi:glycolate oxidase FAD binding subunit